MTSDVKPNLSMNHFSKALTGLLLSAFLLVSVGAEPPETVQQWLEEMASAVRMLNYEGEMIYQHGRQLEVLSLTHTVKDGFERERITSLNGAPREIVRDDNSVVCILSGKKAVSVDQRGGGQGFPSLLPLAVEELTDSYEMSFVGEDRIADQRVRVIDIRPRDRYRYGHRIYIQTESRLPLKLDMLDRKGEPVAQIMFSRLKVDHTIPYEASGPSLRTKGFSLVKHEEQNKKRLPRPFSWSFMELPRGFQINAHQVRKEQENGKLQEHVVLTDGLATVSVYIEKAHKDNDLEGSSRMGAVSAYGRLVGDVQVTAVGEVPADTVQYIAEAVEFRQ